MTSSPEGSEVLEIIQVRITRIRACSKAGCLAFGHRTDLAGPGRDRRSAVVVSVPRELADLTPVEVGGIFEIQGICQIFERSHGTFIIKEVQIQARHITLVRPNGEQLITWLADNVPSVREVKAARLWEEHGEQLYEILDRQDHEALKTILPSEKIRQAAFDAWQKHGDTQTLQFFQEKKIPFDLARKVLRFHGERVVEVLSNDPYRLVSFEADWQRIDRIAREGFGVTVDDERRVMAALEETLYGLAKEGHTCSEHSQILKRLNTLVAPHKVCRVAWEEVVSEARTSGRAVVFSFADEEFLCAPGTFLMEKACAVVIRSLLDEACQPMLFPIDVPRILEQFEAQELLRLGDTDYALTAAQRQAVLISSSARFSLITGGAGVGKTTVLKALNEAFTAAGQVVYQLALSGRAAGRMIESTGHPAMTIAAFVHKVDAQSLGANPVIVIDEASMLDVMTFYRITRKLPAGAHIVLVGDPYQLPPIGAGLILHVLSGLTYIPQTELTEVKRQAHTSPIPAAAQVIRDGGWPAFSTRRDDPVVFLPCADDAIIPTILSLCQEAPADTQVLSSTRHCPFSGVNPINRALHVLYCGAKVRRLTSRKDLQTVDLCIGDRVMYTKNDWPRNLQNGSLGVLTEIYDSPISLDSSEGRQRAEALGIVAFDSGDVQLLASDLEALDYAYALTVHKAQGSQFPRVLVAIRRSRVLDRTLIYTAMTRAQMQVIFVGDVSAAQEAVKAAPKAFGRQVCLAGLVVP